MFKGTNKLAKVLAVALVLCMLPMAAFAEAPTAKTVAITTTADAAAAAYEAGEAIEIAGTTTSGTVTMLAIRDAMEVEDSALTSTFDFSKVVYAGQKAASEGAFSFKFFPKADVTGAMITVFVGGEGVSELADLSFSVAEPAPSFTAQWYKGEDLTITLGRVTDPTAQAAWWEAVDVFKLGETEISKDDISIVDNTTITFTAAYLAEKSISSIASITAVDNDGIYNTAKAEGLSLPALKPAGTISFTYLAEKDYFVAGSSQTIAVNNANAEFGAAWETALHEETGVTIKWGEATVTEWEYSADVLTLTFPTIGTDAEEASAALTISGIENYADATSEAIKLVAPTKLDYDAEIEGLVLEPAFSGAWMEGAPESAEKDDLYGIYTVTLPATGTNGSTYTWTKNGGAVVAGAVELVRPAVDAAEDSASYVFAVTVTKAGCKEYTKTFAAIEVNKYGQPISGHGAPSIDDVTITPAEAGNVVAGVRLTAAPVNPQDNVLGPDAVIVDYEWTVEGKAPVAGENFTPAVADIGKTLTVTATPRVEATEDVTENLVGTPVSKTVTIILDPSFVPTVSVAISGKVYAGSTAAATSTTDTRFGSDATINVLYTWYVVPAELVAEAPDKLAAAIAKVEAADTDVETLTDAAYARTYAKDYAVVKAEATYTIAGVEHATKPVAYAAALIETKASGSSGGGAVLPGAEKPADPKPEDPKPEDPKPEDPVSGDPVSEGATVFTDVNKETYAWAYDGIDALTKAGVFKGMTPTTFGPELTTTNAQVIALAVRIAALKAEEGAKTDLVADDHWVYAEMAAAEANGILGVYGGTVAAEEATTREVAFTLLYNALKAAGVELAETAEAIEYTDASSIDAACVEAITALTKAGIVNGMGDGTLAPKATITRAQLAKILGIAQTLIK